MPRPQVTWKGSDYNTTAGTRTSTPTWTPAANSLLVACISNSYASSPTDPSAVAGHGVSYTKLTLGTSTVGTTHAMSIWVAKAGASPTSAAVATTPTGTTAGSVIIEFEVTSADVTGTALQAIATSSATNNGASGTSATLTLAAAKAAENTPLLFLIQLSNAAPTAAGSWTLSGSAGTGTGASGSYNTPATGAIALFNNSTFDTAGAATVASGATWRMVGIEIAASSPALAAPTDSVGVRDAENAFGVGTGSQADTGALGATDASTLNVTTSPADTAAIGETDTAAVSALVDGVAPTAVQATEAVAVDARIDQADSLALNQTEGSFPVVSVSPADAAAVSETEAVALDATASPADTIAIGDAEIATTLARGEAVETTAVQASEAAALNSLTDQADSLALNAAEAVFPVVSASPSDAMQVIQTEAAFGVGTGSQADSSSVGMSDTAAGAILVSVVGKE